MINVAIDGPAGAGKSTIAKMAAKKLGFLYVDTGALYRAIGLFVLRNDKNPASKDDVVPLLPYIDVSLKFDELGQRVFLGGDDVSSAIRTPSASKASSDVSAIPEVRAFLLDLQRSLAKENNVIMDGRDIGTVILPDADVKIFLTASPDIRAQRRYKEMLEMGLEQDFDELLADIKARDYNDSHRASAPLKMADDAILLDSSNMTMEEEVDFIVNLVKEKQENNENKA